MNQGPVARDRVVPRDSAEGLRIFVRLAAGYAVLGGLVTLLGWTFEIPRLTDWKNDGISMFPNPSLCAVLSGLALLVGNRPAERAIARVAAIVVLALGGLTLWEHLFRVSLGIDTALFDRPWGQTAATAPMRMGPPASTSFFLLGAALFLRTFGGRARSVSAGLGVAVSAIALLSLIGHLYGAQQMYTVKFATAIAMQTASIIVALALATVASVPEREPMRTLRSPGAAGLLARRALPWVLALALGLGWIRLYAQEHGWVDTAFGTAARTFLEIVLLVGVLWGAVRRVRQHEHALRETEGEVRRQAKQLSAFLDTAAIALHRADSDGTILWANDAELRMLGYARHEYVGHKISEFHADPHVIADMLARLHRGEKLVEREARLWCKDGSIKSVLVDSSVLWDEGGFVHTQCFTRDITDRKRADGEREEANRRKDEFMAILGHELRNPLGPIRNAAHFLKLKSPDDADSRRSVEMIERQVAQMARLLDDLLDVSRLSRGSLELRRTRFTLGDVVERAVDTCRHEIEAKGHRLHLRTPSGRVDLVADRERLIQILGNLIGNATKYTPAGGRIDVEVVAGERDLEMKVKDSGIGIPQESLTKIFELFARVDGSHGREGGLGIGLTLVRQLVELHGGTIEARSGGVGKGSEFVLKLPIVAGPDSEVRMAREQASPSVPCRVLVADDNPDAVESLRLLLAAGGHEVRTAFDGEAAVRVAREFQPHVALLDLGMPKADGYEAARRIRSQQWGGGIYLVALTGWGQEADKRRGRDAGFDTHFVKPVAMEALHQLLAGISPTLSEPSAAS